MKDFAIYTLLRIGLFLGAFGITMGIWSLFTDNADLLWLGSLIVAFLVSGIVSYVVLDPYRRRFAHRIEERASRAASKFDERKAAEDDDSR
ncbi:DUF4229 domain-containing protein [Nocardioides sp. AE5]|uniref:DUF4229 domain-containing protein n=1 Tax=Nocardioides sp. AE5 TaxID=2962573 RepID=UPI002882A79F|nr:DUF4229 domain-containing protein [Nocardioides sp. AE5]MDT0200654.1 DUF4229 domain-containing protein [Nocardioides sp. AE5]